MSYSSIEEALERSVFHIIRKKIVELGYLPDINNYDVENNDIEVAKLATEQYKTALTTIKNNKGFAIEIFNYANNQSYGTKKVPRIVVRTEAFLQGQLGADTTAKYEKNDEGVYIKKQSTSLLSDYYFNLYLVCNNVKQMRILHQIMVTSLPRRGYIPWYNKDFQHSSNLLVRYISTTDYSWDAEGIIEKVYRYEIPDAHEVEDYQLTTEEISPIKDIILEKDKEEILNIKKS